MGEIDQRRGRERLEQIRSRELQQRKRPRHCAGVDAAWTPCCGHCSGTPRSRPRVGRRGASRVRGTSATVSQQRGRKFAESERRGGSRGRGRAFLRTLRPVCPSLALTPHTDLSSVALGCHGHRRVASSTLAPSEPELRGFVRVCVVRPLPSIVLVCRSLRGFFGAPAVCSRSLLVVDRRARNRPKRSLTNPLYLLRCARSRSSRLLRLCVHTSSPLPCCPPRRRRRAATLRDPRSVVPIPPRALFDRAPRVLITY